MTSFVDESTECAICLGPLILSEQEEEEEEVEEVEEEENLVVKVEVEVEVEVEGHHNQNENQNQNESTNNDKKKNHHHQHHKHKHKQNQKGVIKLPCGHKYHLECLIAQIQSVGSMLAKNEDQRLLFSGIQCAKCAQLFVGDNNNKKHKKTNQEHEENEDDDDDYYYDDHPAFPKDLLRATDKLRTQVDTLIVEHHLLEGEKEEEEGNIHDNDNENTHQHQIKINRAALFREARRKYAFYLCHHCQKVYFGGTVACADGIPPPTDGGDGDGGSSRNSSPVVETRLCSACTPQAQHIQCCRHPFEHGPYLTWKCRYCCTPATHICYGGVHFCQECHHKNSQRVAADNASRNTQQRRPILEAIPCPGDSCHYPKPPTTTTGTTSQSQSSHHKNGATQDCEQVYSCSVCDSASNKNSNNTNLEPGSRNLIINPNGELGLTGWKRPTNNINRYRMWQVENRRTRRDDTIDIDNDNDNENNHYIPDEPILFPTTATNSDNDNSSSNTTNNHRNPITTNFVSSFTDCVMMQTIDLRRVLQLEEKNTTTTTTTHTTTHPVRNDHDDTDTETDDTIIPIEISARYTGRDDCPSVFLLQALLSNHTTTTETTTTARAGGARTGNRQQRHEERLTTGVLAAPPGNYWERTSPMVFRVSLNELQASLRTGRPNPSVTVIVYGKDTQFWQGNFGSKVAEISVRILGNTEFLTSIVRPEDVDVPPPPSDNGGGGIPFAAGVRAAAGPTLAGPTATTNAAMTTRTHKMIVWDFLVPVVGFLILAWFARE